MRGGELDQAVLSSYVTVKIVCASHLRKLGLALNCSKTSVWSLTVRVRSFNHAFMPRPPLLE